MFIMITNPHLSLQSPCDLIMWPFELLPLRVYWGYKHENFDQLRVTVSFTEWFLVRSQFDHCDRRERRKQSAASKRIKTAVWHQTLDTLNTTCHQSGSTGEGIMMQLAHLVSQAERNVSVDRFLTSLSLANKLIANKTSLLWHYA